MAHIASLPLTGERTAPNVRHENYWFRRHEAAYEWVAKALEIGQSSTIVDAGSGEGYGINLLAQHASGAVAIGLELDWMSNVHAATYYSAQAQFVAANLDVLPLQDESVDLLVSMQVIEHLWDLPRFLCESVRVLTPGGRAIFTTPNRLTFSPGVGRGERPTNPFHVEEFDAEQMASMTFAAGFSQVRLFGLFHTPRISEWERINTSVVQAQVDAALSSEPWPTSLAAFVDSVTTGDFEVRSSDLEMSLDLIVVATKIGES